MADVLSRILLREPRFSNSRRRITSLISASSLTRSGLATAPMTFTILSCHCKSQSVISTWLRGRLITAARWLLPTNPRTMLCRNACIGSARPRCRLNRLSSSSKSNRTGPSTLAMRRLIVSVPGGASFADGPRTATPCVAGELAGDVDPRRLPARLRVPGVADEHGDLRLGGLGQPGFTAGGRLRRESRRGRARCWPGARAWSACASCRRPSG